MAYHGWSTTGIILWQWDDVIPTEDGTRRDLAGKDAGLTPASFAFGHFGLDELIDCSQFPVF